MPAGVFISRVAQGGTAAGAALFDEAGCGSRPPDSRFLTFLMLNPRQIAISPEDFFAQRYGQMLEWSLHLTGGDRAAAEDLLHDLFILFTLRQPDFEAVTNLEGYVYTMLRNLHLSQLRRATRVRLRQLTVVDFDSAELGLRVVDAHERIQARDELRRVCDYVCLRKEKSKSASVLILRFFHGYYPSEIAPLLNVTRKAVDVQLLTARNEARLFLECPATLSLMGERLTAAAGGAAPQTGDFLWDLRELIFRSRRGACLSAAQMAGLYGAGAGAVSGESLAHIVSCARCLDAANKLLGLPSLAERYPMNTLIRDATKKGGGDGGPGGVAGGGRGALARRMLRRWRRQAGEVFEHKPRELCVSVNGYAQGSRRISSEFNDLQLFLDLAEPIKFVEVFSEQHQRLLFLNVELPPEGACVQPSKVELSDGRTLDLSLEFSSPWPTVQLVYHDPAYAFPEAREPQPTQHESPAVEGPDEIKGARKALDNLRDGAAGLAHAVVKLRFWMRPGVVSAGLSLALVAALLFMRVSAPAVSAAELLGRTLSAEEEVAARSDTVVHRTMQLEERVARGGAVVNRRRIETWGSGAKGVTVRRLYDQRGRLLASEWRRSDGSRTVYRLPPEAQTPAPDAQAPGAFDEAWLYEPSAGDFSALIRRGGGATVDEGRDAYVINYSGGEGAGHGVVSASLTISRAGLRATGQTLVIRQGAEEREFRFVETGFDLRPAGAVHPSAFEQDAEFLKVGVTRTSIPPAADDGKHDSPSESQRPAAAASVTATNELEVEVLRLLNQVGADLGEQVNVTRTPRGHLRVHGIVETQARRVELLRALSALGRNPAVEVEVSIAREAIGPGVAADAPASAVVQQVGPADNRFPAEDEMRRYFSAVKGVSDEQVHAAVLRFADRASQRSGQALQHAWAMRRLAGRFSERELRALDAGARAKLLSMIQAHARAVRGESAQLRQELQPIFFSAGRATVDAGAAGLEVADEAGLAGAIERLLALCSATDRGVRHAFSASPDGQTGAALKSVQFWRGLQQAEGLASLVERAAHRMKSAPAAAPEGRER